MGWEVVLMLNRERLTEDVYEESPEVGELPQQRE